MSDEGQGIAAKLREDHGDKGFFIFVGVALIVVAALVPVALAFDRGIDQERSMFEDRRVMVGLQYDQVQETGSPLELEVEGGESTTVGGVEFTPSAGVVVRVRPDGEDPGYCVMAENADGAATDWSCHDGTTNPRRRGD